MQFLKKLCYLIVAFTVSATIASCSKKDDTIIPEIPNRAEEILYSSPWVTTGVKDSAGNEIALDDPKLKGLVGFVYFKSDESFSFYGLNKVLNAVGRYAIEPDGKKLDIKNLNPDGTEIAKYTFNISDLSHDGFTYTVKPNPETAPEVSYTITFSKTADEEPANGQSILASNVWKTTAAKDTAGNEIALDDPKVAGLVEYSYFKANGDFTIFDLNDAQKASGKWSISEDGKNAVLNGTLGESGIAFRRDIQIEVLNNDEFSYKITTADGIFHIFNTIIEHNEPK